MKKVPATTLQSIYLWLIFCNIFIFAMIIIGAITRLTESGLSMVEWKPLIGAIPPLNQEQWQKVFDLYQKTPEFQKKNFWMEIEDFKSIFFWEWLHRLWGRTIGMIYALPFLFFLIKGWIPQGYKLKLFGIFLLGGAQGYMGWYMVQSGLINLPAVSHYRLAAHLSIALLIYSLILWNILDFRQKIHESFAKPNARIFGFAIPCLGILILTIFWGAYTAGLDAGLIYNETFPKMGNTWLPAEIWFYQPFWVNFFENHAGVQFIHRWLALTSGCALLFFGAYSIYKGRREIVFPLICLMIMIQISLGIATLLSGVNIVFAVMHQGGAVILLTLLLKALHILKPLRTTPIKQIT